VVQIAGMTRRGLSVTLLVIFAVQLLGGFAIAAGCPDPCPDDADGAGCAPICALCRSCTHAQTGIVERQVSAVPMASMYAFLATAVASPSSRLAADIFHVPLPG
jgi:hypothetical protein